MLKSSFQATMLSSVPRKAMKRVSSGRTMVMAENCFSAAGST